jgi:transmembrane sensor
MSPSPTDPTQDPDWALLDRYLAGECTPRELAEFEVWLAADPTRRATLEQLALVRAVGGEPTPAIDTRRLWARVAREAIGKPTRRPLWVPERVYRWPAVAAALVVAALGVLWWHGTAARESMALTARHVVTRNGQRATLTLSDSTRVVLSGGSTLRTVAGRGTRDVYLEGEAYFEVRHDATHPFIVHTIRGAAQDVGTAFDVRAYALDRSLRVVVQSGAVALLAAGRPSLRPGDLAVVDSAGRVTVAHGVRVDDYVAWTAGRLVFRDTPLRQAAIELARWYDVDVTLTSGAIAERRVSGSFADTPIEQVLDRIAVIAGVRCARVGRVVVISPESNNAP